MVLDDISVPGFHHFHRLNDVDVSILEVDPLYLIQQDRHNATFRQVIPKSKIMMCRKTSFV